MRSPILGAAITDREQLRAWVKISTRLTHTDPKAEQGAWVIALATRLVCEQTTVTPQQFLTEIEKSFSPETPELVTLLHQTVASVEKGESTLAFAQSLGLERGITGYMLHTVPMVIHAWLAHPTDYPEAIQSLIECGGDSDSTAAIAGGILGASLGEAAIPEQWLTHLAEWPRTTDWIGQLAEQLALAIETGQRLKSLSLPWLAIILRNLWFLLVVLSHGFRRLIPT
jgi:ADP-ribosylglycohydrolase